MFGRNLDGMLLVTATKLLLCGIIVKNNTKRRNVIF